MFFFRIILMALRGLQANMLRSLLATLGVIIGVGAVIAAMSILEGAQSDILEKFESLGSNQLYVLPGEARSGGQIIGTVQTLKLEDVDVLLREAESISAAAPESMSIAQIKWFSKNKRVQILGTNQHYGPMNNYKTVEGEFISSEDVRAKRRVVVLGYRVAKDLFGSSAAVGQPVRIGIPGGRASSFRVIGVMEKKGSLGFRTVDSQVIVPVSTAMKRLFGVNFIDTITVQAADPDKVDYCEREIKKVLRKQHRIPTGYKADFRIFSREEELQKFNEATKLFAIVFYSIAGISLVVGGIGIMNIMLVSVTERTREIGVRIAVGAQRRDILWQFLIEAGSISCVGGAVGVLLGFAMASTLENISNEILEPYTPPKVIVWALMMAVLTGICSGLYPAYVASRLDPVEALRYE